MKSLITFLQPTFTGTDGKASSRKVTAFWVMLIYTITSILFMLRVNQANYLLLSLALHSGFVLLLLGIVTISNLIHFYRIHKGRAKSE
jgi:hypothetical protein